MQAARSGSSRSSVDRYSGKNVGSRRLVRPQNALFTRRLRIAVRCGRAGMLLENTAPVRVGPTAMVWPAPPSSGLSTKPSRTAGLPNSERSARSMWSAREDACSRSMDSRIMAADVPVMRGRISRARCRSGVSSSSHASASASSTATMESTDRSARMRSRAPARCSPMVASWSGARTGIETGTPPRVCTRSSTTMDRRARGKNQPRTVMRPPSAQVHPQ